MILAALYPYVVATHVTAAAVLIGGALAHDRMISAMARGPERQAGALAALLRLDRAVTTPALLLTWSLGFSLALWGHWFPSPWLLAKLGLVVGVSAFHGVQTGRLRRSLAEGRPVKSVPGAGIGIVAAMLAIAVLAIVKPG